MRSWMTHHELVTYYGTATEAAKQVGYSKQALSLWKKTGIPFDVQYRVQLKTK